MFYSLLCLQILVPWASHQCFSCNEFCSLSALDLDMSVLKIEMVCIYLFSPVSVVKLAVGPR